MHRAGVCPLSVINYRERERERERQISFRYVARSSSPVMLPFLPLGCTFQGVLGGVSGKQEVLVKRSISSVRRSK